MRDLCAKIKNGERSKISARSFNATASLFSSGRAIKGLRPGPNAWWRVLRTFFFRRWPSSLASCVVQGLGSLSVSSSRDKNGLKYLYRGGLTNGSAMSLLSTPCLPVIRVYRYALRAICKSHRVNSAKIIPYEKIHRVRHWRTEITLKLSVNPQDGDLFGS